MLYAIFFNSSGPVVQVPCPSGHTVTGRFYKNSVLKKVKEFYNKKRPSKGWSGVLVHLLHDNASSHKCEVVKSFLASEKVKVLNHPPYSPDLSPCDFFLFPRLKKMLSGNKYTSRSSLGSAIYQYLQGVVGWCEGVMYLTSPGRPTDNGLQLGKKGRGGMLYFFCFFTFILVRLFYLSLSFISSTISSISFLPFSGRRHKMTHKG